MPESAVNGSISILKRREHFGSTFTQKLQQAENGQKLELVKLQGYVIDNLMVGDAVTKKKSGSHFTIKKVKK